VLRRIDVVKRIDIFVVSLLRGNLGRYLLCDFDGQSNHELGRAALITQYSTFIIHHLISSILSRTLLAILFPGRLRRYCLSGARVDFVCDCRVFRVCVGANSHCCKQRHLL